MLPTTSWWRIPVAAFSQKTSPPNAHHLCFQKLGFPGSERFLCDRRESEACFWQPKANYVVDATTCSRFQSQRTFDMPDGWASDSTPPSVPSDHRIFCLRVSQNISQLLVSEWKVLQEDVQRSCVTDESRIACRRSNYKRTCDNWFWSAQWKKRGCFYLEQVGGFFWWEVPVNIERSMILELNVPKLLGVKKPVDLLNCHDSPKHCLDCFVLLRLCFTHSLKFLARSRVLVILALSWMMRASNAREASRSIPCWKRWLEAPCYELLGVLKSTLQLFESAFRFFYGLRTRFRRLLFNFKRIRLIFASCVRALGA